MSPTTPIYRYSYSSKRPATAGVRFTARVVIHARNESAGWVLLLLRPVGRWPDREDLAELADACDEKDVPMVSGILLLTETEAAWRAANLRPEADEWAA